jgi:hypothetical protein
MWWFEGETADASSHDGADQLRTVEHAGPRKTAREAG